MTATGVFAGGANERQRQEIILATTTSTYDSGLLDEVIPVFEAATGYLVKIVAVGTGKALQMGREGDADVLLVHAPGREMEFIAAGFGERRLPVMHNDFVIVGPAHDPAKLTITADIAAAMRRLAQAGGRFISRGDDSGTHTLERTLWSQIGIEPDGDWYVESGQGMGATLRIASELGGYTLTDRATYLALLESLDLDVLVAGDAQLLNEYHVLLLDRARFPTVNHDGAAALAQFFQSPQCQAMIAEFGRDRYNQPLFVPDAGEGTGG